MPSIALMATRFAAKASGADCQGSFWTSKITFEFNLNFVARFFHQAWEFELLVRATPPYLKKL